MNIKYVYFLYCFHTLNTKLLIINYDIYLSSRFLYVTQWTYYLVY